MHVNLAAFEPSADGNKYGLVAAMTIEVDKESKLLPIFVLNLNKDSVSALAALKEAPLSVKIAIDTRSQARESSAYKQMEVETSTIRNSRTYALTRTLSYPSHLLINPHRMAMQRRMVGMLKSTVRRLSKQVHLEREWWSYACRFAGHMVKEKVLGRPWQPSVLRTTCRDLERT